MYCLKPLFLRQMYVHCTKYVDELNEFKHFMYSLAVICNLGWALC